MNKFVNRHDAGKILATALQAYQNKSDTIVLALPRGGVPVAYEIAQALSLPLDVLVVRKLGVPYHEELALGAIASGEIIIYNNSIIQDLGIKKTDIAKVIEQEKNELHRREVAYRGIKSFPLLQNKTIILVDDGIATGATMRAAIHALSQQKPARIIVAVPVAALSTYNEMMHQVDEIICILTPEDLNAVGLWYDDFAQTTDEEVKKLLAH